MSNPIIQLTNAGEALYGVDWQSPLARELGVDPRVMRFWVAGSRPVPADVLLRLPDIMRRAARDRFNAAHRIRVVATSAIAQRPAPQYDLSYGVMAQIAESCRLGMSREDAIALVDWVWQGADSTTRVSTLPPG